jgi:hypothetical protein
MPNINKANEVIPMRTLTCLIFWCSVASADDYQIPSEERAEIIAKMRMFYQQKIVSIKADIETKKLRIEKYASAAVNKNATTRVKDLANVVFATDADKASHIKTEKSDVKSLESSLKTIHKWPIDFIDEKVRVSKSEAVGEWGCLDNTAFGVLKSATDEESKIETITRMTGPDGQKRDVRKFYVINCKADGNIGQKTTLKEYCYIVSHGDVDGIETIKLAVLRPTPTELGIEQAGKSDKK